MDKYYHITNYNCFNKIMMYGLIPQNGFRCQSVGDDKCGVFLSKGIYNSIIMFSSMLSYYNKYKSSEGIKEINELKKEIEGLKHAKKHCWEEPIYNKIIDDKNKAINRIIQIRNCNSFNDYLGGYGCLLSVSGISLDNSHPEDCCYKESISPENISLVYIKNMYTNQCIFMIEPILYYLINSIPFEEITKNATSEYKNFVHQLYSYLNNPYFFQIDPNYYSLEEIPISYYNYSYPNEYKDVSSFVSENDISNKCY